MKLSAVIPVRNEEKCLRQVVEGLVRTLESDRLAYEIILVNDHSTDSTGACMEGLQRQYPGVRISHSPSPYGFGLAIRSGLEIAAGEVVVIFMGDGSDDPQDVLRYYHKIASEGFDCAFGSRFMKASRTKGYPWIKFILNRMGNKFIQMLFMISYNDVSNAFKAYKIEVIRAVQPLVSQYFNITVEIPLKAIVRGFSYAVIPISWNGRESGVSKYHIRELSRKYFFSILFVWLEKILLKEEINHS